MNSSEFNLFKTDVENYLTSLKEKYKLNIKAGSINYDNDNLYLKLEISNISKNNNKEVSNEVSKEGSKSFEQLEFEKYCAFAGLNPENYNEKFKYHGKEFKITGIKPNSQTYQIVAKNLENGKPYKFMKNTVKGTIDNNNLNKH